MKAPRAAIAADLLAAALFLLGTCAMFAGWSLDLGFLRVSVRSPWRPYMWAALIIIIRRYFVPDPPPFAPLLRSGEGPLPADEHQLFGVMTSAMWRQVGLLAVVLGGLTIAYTWPQIVTMYSSSDQGDPLFSVWRLSWVSHQLLRDPLHLFDGNQFYPEHYTLTYSDAMLVPGLMAAPLLWLGVPQVVAYNILFLLTFVMCGVAMFLLARALTGRSDAALVAALIFTLYPYRFEHYAHLELQMSMWMPLSLWALHRALASGSLRDGLLTGLMFACQTLSSLYYGLFLAAGMATLGFALWLSRGRPAAPIAKLAAGGVLAAVLISPVAAAYIASSGVRGDRETPTVAFYSAKGNDYLAAHGRSRTYQWLTEGAQPERALFPRITPVVLSAAALWPPLSSARIGYAAMLVLAFDGSLGYNGQIYPGLRENISPFKGLRVPARFSMLAGVALSVLSAYGAMRLMNRWPRARLVTTGVLVAAVLIEALPVIPLEAIPPKPPDIYGSLSADAPAVLAEFPMPGVAGTAYDARFIYFSTFHWQKLVNGESGFFPPSYHQLIEKEKDFPSDAAIEYLKSRGVQYVGVHGLYYGDRYPTIVAALDARPDMELVTKAPWEGSESRLYKLK